MNKIADNGLHGPQYLRIEDLTVEQENSLTDIHINQEMEAQQEMWGH